MVYWLLGILQSTCCVDIRFDCLWMQFPKIKKNKRFYLPEVHKILLLLNTIPGDPLKKRKKFWLKGG